MPSKGGKGTGWETQHLLHLHDFKLSALWAGGGSRDECVSLTPSPGPVFGEPPEAVQRKHASGRSQGLAPSGLSTALALPPLEEGDPFQSLHLCCSHTGGFPGWPSEGQAAAARGDRFLLPAALLLPQGARRPLRMEPGCGEWVKLSGERGGPCPFPLAELPPDDRTLPAAGRLSALPSLKTGSCQWVLFQGNYCA